jgi:hypothetical protein
MITRTETLQLYKPGHTKDLASSPHYEPVCRSSSGSPQTDTVPEINALRGA